MKIKCFLCVFFITILGLVACANAPVVTSSPTPALPTIPTIEPIKLPKIDRNPAALNWNPGILQVNHAYVQSRSEWHMAIGLAEL